MNYVLFNLDTKSYYLDIALTLVIKNSVRSTKFVSTWSIFPIFDDDGEVVVEVDDFEDVDGVEHRRRIV